MIYYRINRQNGKLETEDFAEPPYEIRFGNFGFSIKSPHGWTNSESLAVNVALCCPEFVSLVEQRIITTLNCGDWVPVSKIVDISEFNKWVVYSIAARSAESGTIQRVVKKLVYYALPGVPQIETSRGKEEPPKDYSAEAIAAKVLHTLKGKSDITTTALFDVCQVAGLAENFNTFKRVLNKLHKSGMLTKRPGPIGKFKKPVLLWSLK